jgi:flagellar motility protein MotE (MotC chaperone)
VGIALGGVLAVKLLSGVAHVPDLAAATKAFAEGVVSAKTQDAGKTPDSSAPAADPNAPVLPPGLTPTGKPLPGSPEAIAAAANQQAQSTPKIACPSAAADLARDAGLSPAELQVLQSLGARRGQLDEREQDLDVQNQLLTAAETKLDAKLQAMAAMKADLQKLLDDGDQKRSAEIDDLVTVYSKMRPAEAAQRLALLDDSVRLPIAAKMKPSALSAIVGVMSPTDAKDLTEKLAGRFDSKVLADARQAVSGQPAAANGQPAGATPGPAPKKLAKGRKAQLAANTAPPAAGASPAPTTGVPAAATSSTPPSGRSG